jgi:protein-tyrosine phosphatase
MHTYSVRSWDNAIREYYLFPEHRYFVTIVDDTNKNRIPDFGHSLDSEHWIKLVLDGHDTFEIKAELKRLLEWHKNVPDGEHIVIHCSYGITRSPSMALSMMIADGLNGKEALDKLYSQEPLPECSDSEFELSPRIMAILHIGLMVQP